MTDEEKRLIEHFAAADPKSTDFQTLKTRAIAAHRRYCTPELFQDSWGDHMAFMSEVDTPSPDLSLRAMYRARLRKLFSPA